MVPMKSMDHVRKKNFNAKILIEVGKQLQGKQIENKQDLFMNQL